MTSARSPLVVALAVAGFLLVQSVVVSLIDLAFFALDGGLRMDDYIGSVVAGYVPVILRILVFAAGVLFSLRVVAPVEAHNSWRQVIVRGVVATLLGAAAVVLLGLAQAIADSVSPGAYPFGYSFSPTFTPSNLGLGVLRAFEGALAPLVNWAVPVILAVVLLKLWVGRRTAAVTAPASVFA